MKKVIIGFLIQQNFDVSVIITQRLNAMRKLQENPLDSEAIKAMYTTQKDVCFNNTFVARHNMRLSLSFCFLIKMSTWANSKFVPGRFTGSTGANVLSAKELQSGFQAWAKRVSSSRFIVYTDKFECNQSQTIFNVPETTYADTYYAR